jgi:DNA repair protein RadA/Sms
LKEKTVYVCKECGYESPKWFGKCPVCGSWNSAVEMKKQKGRKSSPSPLVKLSEMTFSKAERIKSGVSILDDALGGGFVKGQVILLGGEPGVGKSTLALQIANSMSKSRYKVLYASGEESMEQVGIRASRLAINSEIFFSGEQEIEELLKITKDFDVLIVDSIQTFYSSEIGNVPGGVVQLKTLASKVVEFSKSNGTISILVGHITKSGDIAGPKLVEHIVDTVLYFEGEKTTDYRILRVHKNRFGPSGEVAIFEMGSEGLKEVRDPVLVDDILPFGNAVACVMEGTHPVIVQVQALASKSRIPSPRKSSIGVELNRVSAIVATMSKILKLPLDFHEIYVKILGGLRITDPAVDLAIAAAVFSSFVERELGKKVFIGEVGLDGRVRIPYGVAKRIEVIKRSGLKEVVGPFKEATISVKHLSDLAGVIE